MVDIVVDNIDPVAALHQVLGVGRQVEHQPEQPDGGQPVDDPALSWPARGDDDGAWEDCQQELGVGGEDPLGDQRGCGGRQWW